MCDWAVTEVARPGSLGGGIYLFKLDLLTRLGLLDTVSLVQELQGRGSSS